MWSIQSVCYKWSESKDFKALAICVLYREQDCKPTQLGPTLQRDVMLNYACMNHIFPFILTLQLKINTSRNVEYTDIVKVC
jgi:hypothetical protein